MENWQIDLALAIAGAIVIGKRPGENRIGAAVPDSTRENAFAGIAAIGFALGAYPIGVERAYMTRPEAVERTRTTLRFFCSSSQSTDAHARGYKDFYYHFLDMRTRQRAPASGLSIIESTCLLAAASTAAMYFDDDTVAEKEIRALAEALYARADWQWARNGALKASH